MTNFTRRTIAAALLCSVAAPTFAADATPDGAARLANTFEKYFGKAVSGETPAMTVAPNGEAYTLTFHIDRFVDLLRKAGAPFSVAPSAWTFNIAPQPDGKWKTSYGAMPPLAVTTSDGAMTITIDGVAGGGVFDPALPGYLSDTANFASISSESTNSKPGGLALTMSRKSADIEGQLTGTMISPGVQSATYRQTIGATTQNMLIASPAKSDGVKTEPIAINVAIGATTTDVALESIRNRGILDLWAFAVAHPSKNAIRDSQVELKNLIRAALPLFDRIDGKADIKSISVTSPIGKVSVGAASVGLAMNGAVENGSFGEEIAATGIELPDGLLPPWAKDLSPRDVSLGVDVEGFDLARSAETIISALNLEFDPPLKPDVGGAALAKLLPRGALDVKLNGIRVANAAYEVTVDGALKVSPGAAPSGSGTVRAKGLDAVQKALAEGAKTDKNAANAVGALALARALAKAGPDGTSTWEIVMSPEGQLTVNGAPLGGGKK
jgi:hypothetical protein